MSKNLRELDNNELMDINGGGLVEDIGYAAHAVVDAVCTAAEAIADAVSDAWDYVTSMFD